MAQIPTNANMESVVTLNGFGRTSTKLNEINARFVELAGKAKRPVLDLGCAMGVASLAALAAGGTVYANDLNPDHLRILTENVPHALRGRLITVPGSFPQDLAYSDKYFDVIHASNLLNFLRGDAIECGFAAIARWLAPGGVFLSISGSPYAKNVKGFISKYEEAVAAGVAWPGECQNLHYYSDDPTVEELPQFLHLLDPTVLSRTAKKAGLIVEQATFFNRRSTPYYIRHDGRENVILIARRPNVASERFHMHL